jgi:2,3-bisphosphoglycerate-independent phosphoglycerate mutase
MSVTQPTVLCIVDGFGINPNPLGNAVLAATKPNFDRLFANYPHNTLVTHGVRVGLPEGYMGNSEVGHLNIGAGRVVLQWLYRISHELKSGFLERSATFSQFSHAITPTAKIHLVGLYSDGGVHSYGEHLHILIDRLLILHPGEIVLHLITDGRDTAPQIAAQEVRTLLTFLETRPRCTIASVSGRFYAMDRDKRWERTKCAYDAIVGGIDEGTPKAGIVKWIESAYQKGTGDEFLEPAVFAQRPINDADGVIFWNFRADRMRQLVAAMTQTNFDGFVRVAPSHAATRTLLFTNYNPTFKLPYLFEPITIEDHLGAVVSNAGLQQLRTAETEKYPHVTYFFNGGVETAWPGEERSLIPSPREVKTYDEKPEMSAFAVKDVVVNAILALRHDLIVVNFANCDMVGHTGVLAAATRAVEVVDQCVGEITKALDSVGGQMLLLADHGNCEQMIDYETGVPHTAHTTFPVPVLLYTKDTTAKLRGGGALCDVAPTILTMMNLPQPNAMTGRSLL